MRSLLFQFIEIGYAGDMPREWMSDNERAEVKRKRPWRTAEIWLIGVLMVVAVASNLSGLF